MWEILASCLSSDCRRLGVREHHVDNTRCNPSPRLDKRPGEGGPVKVPVPWGLPQKRVWCRENRATDCDGQRGHLPLSMCRGSSAWGRAAPTPPCLCRAGHQGSSRRTLGPPAEPGTALRAAGGCRVLVVSGYLALFAQGFPLESQCCFLQQL